MWHCDIRADHCARVRPPSRSYAAAAKSAARAGGWKSNLAVEDRCGLTDNGVSGHGIEAQVVSRWTRRREAVTGEIWREAGYAGCPAATAIAFHQRESQPVCRLSAAGDHDRASTQRSLPNRRRRRRGPALGWYQREVTFLSTRSSRRAVVSGGAVEPAGTRIVQPAGVLIRMPSTPSVRAERGGTRGFRFTAEATT